MKKILILIASILLFATGCFDRGNGTVNVNQIEISPTCLNCEQQIDPIVVEQDEDFQITIGYFNEDQFWQRYEGLLSQTYPNLRVTILPTSDVYRQRITLKEWLNDNNPDLLYIPGHMMSEISQEGLLQPLNATIKNENFDLLQYVPEVIDLTRQYGQGEIYGLPPTFDGRAILYNRTLFDKLNIEYPVDAMSWKEIIGLAEQIIISNNDRDPIYGLVTQHMNPYHFIWSIGSTNDLRSYNSTTKQVVFNSQSWAEVWEMGINALNSGAVHIADINNLADMFLNEQTAMLFATYEQFNQFSRVQLPFEWVAVTAPVNENRRNQSDQLFVDGFYTIPAASTNKELAWALMKFLNSEMAAKWGQQSMFGFSTHQSVSYVESNVQRNVKAFAGVNPIPAMKEMPYELIELGGQIYNEVLPDLSNLQASLDKLQDKAESYAAELK